MGQCVKKPNIYNKDVSQNEKKKTKAKTKNKTNEITTVKKQITIQKVSAIYNWLTISIQHI